MKEDKETWFQLFGRMKPKPPKASEPARLAAMEEQTRIVQEIRKALADWRIAQQRFEEALGHDQVDYAIYLLEAAEKKYGMLLRAAKNQQIQVDVVAASESSAKRRALP